MGGLTASGEICLAIRPDPPPMFKQPPAPRLNSRGFKKIKSHFVKNGQSILTKFAEFKADFVKN